MNTIYASQVAAMDRPFATGEPGPAFFPMILYGFVYIAAAWIVIAEFRAAPAARSTRDASDTIPALHVIGPLVAIGLTALFIVTFFYAGYAVAAALYTFLIALFFNYETSGAPVRSALIALATSVGVTLFGWLFFVKLFDLYLPVWGA